MAGKSAFIIGIPFFFLISLSGCSQTEKIPDFSAIEEVETRKNAFFSFLSPLIESENQKIRRQRSKLDELHLKASKGRDLSWLEQRWLNRLADQYAVTMDPENDSIPWQRLKERVDIVPRSLALVQAAIESAWGTSRFAKQGRNFYGEHCTTDGCGIQPKKLGKNAAFEVESFDSVASSVQSYIKNLNTHQAYDAFREMRQAFRDKGKPLDAHALARTLHAYSEKKQAYTRSLQAMLNQNAALIKRL